VLHRRGFSLLEVTLYMVLLSLFAVVFFVSLPVKTNTAQENLGRSVEKGSLLLNKIHQGITNSASTAVKSWSEGEGLIYLSAVDPNSASFQYKSEGEIQWKEWRMYVLQGRNLFYDTYPYDPANQSVFLKPETMASRLDSDEVVLSDVASFQAMRNDGVWSIKVELESGRSSFTLETAAVPRNTR